MWDSARQRVSDFAADWAGPIGLSLVTAAAVWIVWHFTKPACTAMAAANGLCNPGIVARYITVEILLQSGGAALAVGALKGGYDKFMMRRMLNEEREARRQAELELAEARQRADEAIQQANEARDAALQMIAEIVNELREERQRSAEERQLTIATQQALLDAVVSLTRQQNGNGHAENGDG